MNQYSFSIPITNFSQLKYLSILTVLFLLPKTYLSVIDSQFQACVPKTCGDGKTNISYPFWIDGRQQSYCGYPGFNVSCNNNGHPIVNISNNTYIIQNIFYHNQSFRLVNAEFFYRTNSCFPPIQNLTVFGIRYSFPFRNSGLFLYPNCSSSLPENLASYKVNCSDDDGTGSGLAVFGQDPNLDSVSKICRSGVRVPVELYGDEGNRIGEGSEYYVEVLRRGFVLNWTASSCSECDKSGGRCGFDEDIYHFKCYCPDKPHSAHCVSRKNKLALILATVIPGVVGILIICLLLFYCIRVALVETPNHQNVEVFLRNCRSIFPKRYSYSAVKKMTYSFKDKLGQGGYGGVFKGKLLDGRPVAVKVLNKSKGDGQEFVNEVASISRTSHVNVVTLLGFCFEGSKRALIYEFMPNGSLEKFIYENPSRDHQLGWETLYQIAIGIARGLEYLHRGCNTRILHFDIKPHNILLDEDFCPKISDFGLAKLCPKDESIISMLDARGTAGYIAPEVFCRNIGGVSHKSDVYSYGMMVLEMVGGRKNLDLGVDHTSQIYFPYWVYKRLEQGDQLGLHGIMNEEENEKARKMVLVSLWCIQTDPSNRPPMGAVVEMLQGSLGSLQVPPRPFLSSPPRSQADSLATLIITS